MTRPRGDGAHHQVAKLSHLAGTKKLPWMTSDNLAVATGGLKRWAQRSTTKRVELAKKYVEASITGLSTRPTNVVLDEIMAVTDDVLLKLYDEVFIGGDMSGDSVRRLVGPHLKGGVVTKNVDETMVALALEMRAEERLAEGVARLIDEGIALPASDHRVGVMLRYLGDKLWTKRADGTRAMVLDPATLAWAEGTAAKWGLNPGTGVLPERLAGTDIVLPKHLADDLESMRRQGIQGTHSLWDIGDSRIAATAYRLFKKGVTHGLLAFNAPYYAGQALSMLPMLYTTRGLADAASTPFTMAKNAGSIKYLLENTMRAKPRSMDVSRGAVLQTVDGRVYSRDELLDLVRRGGLDESAVRVENAEQLADYVRREAGRGSSMNPIHIAMNKGRTWQALIEDFASVFDNMARYNVLIEDLRKGLPEAVALQNARKAVLDFDDLTPGGKRWGRLAFTFYAFTAKNVDAYTESLFKDPSRFFGQMRLANENYTAFFTSEEAQSWSPQQMSRATLYRTDEIVRPGGGVDWRYSGLALQSTPLGPLEFINSMRLFTAAPAMALSPLNLEKRADSPTAQLLEGVLQTDTAFEDLLGNANPIIELSMIFAAGQTSRMFSFTESPQANRVPDFWLDGPWGDTIMRHFEVEAVPIRLWEDGLATSPSASESIGEPAYWTVGGSRPDSDIAGKRKEWQAVLALAGRELNSISQAGSLVGAAVSPMVGGTERPLGTPQGTKIVPQDMTLLQLSLMTQLGLRAQPVDSPLQQHINNLRDLDRALRDRNAGVQSQLNELQRVR